MRTLGDLPLVRASVARSASFGEAADALLATHVPAIAVLDDEERVVGLFTEDDLVAGVFPGYLKHLHHTAFARGLDAQVLTAGIARIRADSVERHMRAPVTAELDASPAHAAERFVHVSEGALAVVERGRFVGMLAQRDFVRTLLERADS